MKNFEEFLNVKTKDIEAMTEEQREKYFDKCRAYCRVLGEEVSPGRILFQRTVGGMQHKYQTVIDPNDEEVVKGKDKKKRYDVIIEGLENIPDDGCIIATNHTNAHDAFTIAGILYERGVPFSIMGAKDGISPIAKTLLDWAGTTLIDRTDPISSRNGLYEFCSKVENGYAGVILPEGTWNFHPTEKMLNFWPGVIKAAAISGSRDVKSVRTYGKPLIPMIMEYIEKQDIVGSEKELYETCYVKIGTPIYINPKSDLEKERQSLRATMIKMREEVQEKCNGKVIRSLDEVDPELYINHTWLRAYGTPIPYPYADEVYRIYVEPGKTRENMFCLDSNGKLVPGQIPIGLRKKPPFYKG